MKRYNLIKVVQNRKEFYALVADPRVIVRLILNVAAGKEQEAQRPWNEIRVREIAKYVAGKFKDNEHKKAIGLIPNAPILNIKKKINVKKDGDGYYLELPETDGEFQDYIDSIEVIDGQHRVRAFMKDYMDIDFLDSTKYDMIFTVFDRLAIREKQELFMITNEKQVKVPGNLLRLFKRELDLLKGDEAVYDLVAELEKEDYSPLQGRIMLGAKKITKGYQESQLSKILNKSETYKVLAARKYDQTTMGKIISNYLKAWEKVYDVQYKDPGKDTITKISGLRYVFFLFPACLEILGNRKKPATADEFKKIIDLLPLAIEVEDVFADSATLPAFRGEGATITMAKEHTMKLKAYEQRNQDDFDITDGI